MKYIQIIAILLLFNRLQASETHLQTIYSVNNEVVLQRDIPQNWSCEFSTAISFNQAIQLHLSSVIEVLSLRNVRHLSRSQQNQREYLLNILKNYTLQGKFPVNDYLTYQNPVFIDCYDTHCAVGFLMQQSHHVFQSISTQKCKNISLRSV